MKIQKSFQNSASSLYIVATPIGNLKEMTPRAIEILKSVDLILAEDTRTSGLLLNHFGINTKTTSYHKHNETKRIKEVLDRLQSGESLAIISDAGYPLISDPGQLLVNKVLEKGFNVIPISGSSAFLNALVASGQITQPFTFMGFLESKDSLLKSQIESVKNIPHTLVFYVSVHKLEKTIETILNILGNRSVTLAREITKLHEEFIRTDLKTLNDSTITLKGEFVLVIEGKNIKEEMTIEVLLQKVEEEIKNGLSPSRSISKVAKKYSFSKNELYNSYQSKVKS